MSETIWVTGPSSTLLGPSGKPLWNIGSMLGIYYVGILLGVVALSCIHVKVPFSGVKPGVRSDPGFLRH